MATDYAIISLAILAAAAYLAYRIKQTFDARHNPCRGCAGCALQQQISRQKAWRKQGKPCERRKKPTEEIKNTKKFGGTK